MRRFLILLLFLPLSALASLPDFRASYDFERGRMKIGESTFELERSQENIYRYTSEAKATGFLSIFVDDVIREESIFKYEDDRFWPVSYEYRQLNSDKDRNENIAYNWTDNIAAVSYRGHESSQKLSAGMLDRFLMQLAISVEAQQGRFDRSYNVLDNGRVKQYRIRSRGMEEISTPAGTFMALRVDRVDRNADKFLRMWLAPELDYLPVKIEQEKRNEEPLRLTLRSIALPASPPETTETKK